MYLTETETWYDASSQESNRIRYIYDVNRNVKSLADQFSTLAFDYDNGRRLERATLTASGLPTSVVEYQLNAADQVTEQEVLLDGVPVRRLEVGHNASGRVNRLTEHIGTTDVVVAMTFNAQTGYVEEMTRSAGTNVVRDTYTYDPNSGFLMRLVQTAGDGTILQQIDYDYDVDGRVRTMTTDGRTANYTYDASGQIIDVTYTGTNPLPTEKYRYDAAGNRIESHRHGTNYVTIADNRVSSDGIYSYTYDVAGNLKERAENATGKRRTLDWDARNRLVGFQDRDSAGLVVASTEYRYDVQNRRIAKGVDTDVTDSTPATWRYFVYGDGDNILAELIDVDGPTGPTVATLDKRYVFGLRSDQVLASVNAAGEVTWLLGDHLRVSDAG